MKLKTATRGQLDISCCQFRQADRGLGPDPDAVLYRPGPIVNKLFKYYKYWRGAFILTGATSLADQEVHWPTACKLSHPTWCCSANQICAFQAINIATLNLDRWKRWEVSDRWKDECDENFVFKTKMWTEVLHRNDQRSCLTWPVTCDLVLVHFITYVWWRVTTGAYHFLLCEVSL